MYIGRLMPVITIFVCSVSVSCQNENQSKIAPYTDLEINIDGDLHVVSGNTGTVPIVDQVTPDVLGDCVEYWLLRLGEEGHSAQLYIHFDRVVGLGATASLDEHMYSTDAVPVPALIFYSPSEDQWYSVNGGTAEVTEYRDDRIDIEMTSTEKCEIEALDQYETDNCVSPTSVGISITPSGDWPISLGGMCITSHDNENVGNGQWCFHHGESSDCETIADDF